MNKKEIIYEDEIIEMSHEEFKNYTMKLSKKISNYLDKEKTRIDYVVPILRSGAVPAVYIANELNLVKFAPIQVKKVKQDGIYDHIVLQNSLKDIEKDKKVTLLVVEGTYSTGESTKKALETIKETLPNAEIILSIICIRGKENMPNDIKKGFFGFDLPIEKLFTYPWEKAEDKETHLDQLLENIYY